MKRIVITSALMLIFVAASWSLFQPGLFRVHDYTHAARIAEMARGWQDGQLPVRWSANFGYGYGMPLFVFYAPLPYLAGAFFWLFGFGTEISVKALFVIPTIVSMIASFYLARRWLNEIGSVLAVAAITLAPYRAVNLFVRGAISESWGMAFFVVSLLGITLTFDKKRWGWLVLLIGLTGTMLSHNLTMLMSVPFFGGFLVILILESFLIKKVSLKKWFDEHKHSLLAVILSGLLALGLSAFYWIPALAEKSASQLDSYILSDYFNFRLHFLYIRQFLQENWSYGGSSWGPVDDISFFLGWGQLIGMILSIVTGCVVIIGMMRKKVVSARSRELTFWIGGFGLLVLGLGALGLSLNRALPVWESLSFLKYLQFPWRFLAIATPLLGLASVWWVNRWSQHRWYWPAAIFVLILVLSNGQFFRPEKLLPQGDKQYSSDQTDIQTWLSGVLIDYVPTGFSPPLTENPLFAAPSDGYCLNTCTLQSIVNNSHQALYSVSVAQPTILVLHRTYFPGWIAEVNGNSQPIVVGENAKVTVAIPAGDSQVGIRFDRTASMTIADVITILSALTCLYLIVRTQKSS